MNSCGTGKCGSMYGNIMSGHGCKHRILKKILMLVLIVIVFHFGVQIGELRAGLRMNQEYGYGMMQFGQ